MQKIDAHQHFWYYQPTRDTWITDDMTAIKTDFLPSDLWPTLQQNGFDGCVAVQADQSEEETNFLLSLAEKHDFIKGVVGWVNLLDKNVETKLKHYRKQKKLKGFRHVLQAETQRDFMLRDDFLEGLSILSKYNFSYDVLIHEDQLPFIPLLVQRFPQQRFVLDHLAKPLISEGKIEQWQHHIKTVASYKNVWCKISGMVTEADWNNWEKEDFTPYLDVVTEAFGIERLMFGSDWPVCLVAATYTNTLGIVKDYFSRFSLTDLKKFFGDNAIEFYQLA